MELRDALTTTPATRDFTDEPVSDADIYRLLDIARFAPNGGNRQGWYVLVVRDAATRAALVAASEPAARRYAAQKEAGEQPWNTVHPTTVDAATIADTAVSSRQTSHYLQAPALLLICLDLSVVASIDSELDRVGVISGASIYPFAWSILLSAREAGLGGVMTTLPVAAEPALQQLLGIPSHVAIAAVVPIGHPVKQITKLKRGPVEEFARLERWDGSPLTAG